MVQRRFLNCQATTTMKTISSRIRGTGGARVGNGVGVGVGVGVGGVGVGGGAGTTQFIVMFTGEFKVAFM